MLRSNGKYDYNQRNAIYLGNISPDVGSWPVFDGNGRWRRPDIGISRRLVIQAAAETAAVNSAATAPIPASDRTVSLAVNTYIH